MFGRSTLYFRDGKRKIDFILVYKDLSDPQKEEKRRIFEGNLKEEGLELELEDKSLSQDGKTYFLKIHSPWDFITRYAELMNIKIPLKEAEEVKSEKFCSSLWCFERENPFIYNNKVIPDEPRYFSCAFKRSHQEDTFHKVPHKRLMKKFISVGVGYKIGLLDLRKLASWKFFINDEESFLTPTQRIHVIWEVLIKTEYEEDAGAKKGIMQLLNEGTYATCYPLHDGHYIGESVGKGEPGYCERTILYNEWAQPACWYKTQPLCLIKRYFGEKTAFYFMWLGFYTTMLIPAAACGILTVLYGFPTIKTSTSVQEICDEKISGNIIMCPLCNRHCGFWHLKDMCIYSKILNKKSNAERPLVAKMVIHIFDNSATVSFAVLMSFWASIFIALWKRKQAQIAWEWNLSGVEHTLEIVRPEYEAKVFTYKLNPLTRNYHTLERPRTLHEYEDSFTFKMFVFVFINTYSALIYTAFFKGRFFGHPGDTITIFGHKQDKCDSGHCFFEVLILLSIVMVGKQIFNNVYNFTIMKFTNWWRSYRRSRGRDVPQQTISRWEEDYNLDPADTMALFDEYLTMVIQFGFLTLFVSGFPLAPAFALLNNVIEIRLDAYKYVTNLRRPIPLQVQNIGAWQSILKGLSSVAIITNSFIIAYTTNFIPRLVYMFIYSYDGSLRGYVNNSLSYFDTSDFTDISKPENMTLDGKHVYTCRYLDYRHPPSYENKYSFSLQYWHIFAARLAFIVVFEHLVIFVTSLIAYFIPNIPRNVQTQIKQEQLLAQEALYRDEMRQSRRPRSQRRHKSRAFNSRSSDQNNSSLMNSPTDCSCEENSYYTL
ncbi:anoctamin-5-like [Tachypleus tridentatus]|uniref:anoctamin-5-like n=1 Tax=Tachypleus tridentatus TaxID=6853 RepID=UPI003FD38A05